MAEREAGEVTWCVASRVIDDRALLLAKIAAKVTVVDRGFDTPCHEAAYGLSAHRYPTLEIRGRKLRVHRAVYVCVHGPMPSGVVVRHLCNNPRCCNPEHLAAGTHADNRRDAADAGVLGRKGVSEDAVRDMRTGRLTQGEFAELYGIHPRMVRFIQKRQRYARVEG